LDVSTLGAAVPVPTGATVGPSKGRVTYWALTAGVLLVLLIPVAVVDAVLRDGDVGLVVTLCAYYLGMGISSLIRGGEIAGWENEHRVEFLRARWRRGPQELYVRARVMSNSTSLADA
jgi:hypothetical protein